MSNQSIPDPADAVYSHEVQAERPWSRLLKRGQTLRIDGMSVNFDDETIHLGKVSGRVDVHH